MGITGNFRSYKLTAVGPQIFFSPDSGQTFQSEKSLNQFLANQVASVNGQSFKNRWEFDFLIDLHQIGDNVTIRLENGKEISTKLVQRYGNENKFLVPLLLLLGMTFWAIGFYVLKTKPRDWAARTFFVTCMMATIAVMIIWPGCPKVFDIFGLFYVILYWFVFPLIPAFILYFTLLYPDKSRILFGHQKYLIFLPGLLLLFLLEFFYLFSVFTTNLEYYRIFYKIYNYGFRSYLLIYLVLSFTAFIFAYYRSQLVESRKKVLWIIWGFAFGLFPFLFLWTLPQLVGYPPLISEIAMYIFMMFFPVSIAVSIIKYQALNIEFIVEKSIIYFFSALIFFLLFLLVVALTDLDFRQIALDYRLQLYISLIVLAVLFSPLLSQKLFYSIKRYFGGEYNFPLILKKFNSVLSTCSFSQNVFELFTKEISVLLPAEKIAVIAVGQKSNLIEYLETTGFTSPEIKELKINYDLQWASTNMAGIQNTSAQQLTGKEGKETLSQIYKQSFKQLFFLPVNFFKNIQNFLFVQPKETNTFYPKNNFLKELDIQMVQPIYLSNKFVGTVLLGQKKSKKEWTEEEINLVSQMASEAFQVAERLELQQAMILEQTEKKKLEELHQLKSDFVSLVSHELQSPLTSITWSADNLLDGIPEKPSPKIAAYLAGIRDSSQHLSRMIKNLLDLTKIEAGMIEFYPQKLNLQACIVQAIETVKPPANDKNIKINYNVDAQLWVRAEKDFLREILTNLLDNAIKYSEKSSKITIEAFKSSEDKVTFSVIDQGIGIPEESLATIFDRFARLQKTANNKKGLGLGLHIVDQLVKLQGGTITVSSTINAGSTFRVTLPDCNK